ncbi:MAG: TauD/TfdA family dioxygenase [Gammaproteobacteria bacterium]|nr:TauD/TfdA family dioxygenase [Gammaproteobacteria bacterium]
MFKTCRGQELWFNQLSECNTDYWLQHADSELMGYTRDTCQSDTAYGDGEPFLEDIRTQVRAALWQSAELVTMEASDVIVLDNHIMQHGRMAYTGNRRHLAALARFALAPANFSD